MTPLPLDSWKRRDIRLEGAQFSRYVTPETNGGVPDD